MYEPIALDGHLQLMILLLHTAYDYSLCRIDYSLKVIELKITDFF